MSIHPIFRVKCDHCGKTVIVNTVDSMAADRILVKRGWATPILSFYGGVGQYCPSDACQKKAKEVEYKL